MLFINTRWQCLGISFVKSCKFRPRWKKCMAPPAPNRCNLWLLWWLLRTELKAATTNFNVSFHFRKKMFLYRVSFNSYLYINTTLRTIPNLAMDTTMIRQIVLIRNFIFMNFDIEVKFALVPFRKCVCV